MSDDPREALAAVARDILAKRGYVGLTMKTAAAAAGVTPEVARRYYRNREALFAAALRLPMDPATAIPTLVAPGLEGMGERLVRYTLDVLKDGDTRAELVSLARTGVNAGHAVSGLQDFLETAVVDRMASMIGVPDARMRSALITSYLLGVAMMRYGVRLEPLSSAGEEEVIRMVAPVIQDLLDPRKPLPGSARARSSASGGAPSRPHTAAPAPAPDQRRPATTSTPPRPAAAAAAPLRREAPAPRTFDPDPKATAARRAAQEALAAAAALGRGDDGQSRAGSRAPGSRTTGPRTSGSRAASTSSRPPATPASDTTRAEPERSSSRAKSLPRARSTPQAKSAPRADAGPAATAAPAATSGGAKPPGGPRHAAPGEDEGGGENA